MRHGLFSILPLAAALTVASPASADQVKSITATGTGTARVVVAKPLTDASIQAALEVATKAAAVNAIRDAHGLALVYAKAAGLTLGTVVSVSDAQNGNSGFAYYGPGPFFGGPGGPGQFCRQVPVGAFKRIRRDPQAVIVDRRHRRVCFVPRSTSDSLSVTYSAS